MYGVARLYSLRVLNLSHNNIVSIEGLKDMKYLSHLNLAGNNIKSIEHLNANLLLEHLDLSDNAITTIPDMSGMKQLKRLHLHQNRIKALQFCEKFLPPTLTYLTLAENALTDLNDLSKLVHLAVVEVFSIAGNPCTATAEDQWRPFVLNWLPGLKILDESLVSAKETLVAEWLYSLGRGRQFKSGQHDELVAYLASVRPEITAPNGQPEDPNKLDKILHLARQNHHCDLQQAVSATSSPVPQRRSASASAASAAKRAVPSRKQNSPPKDVKPQQNKTTEPSPRAKQPYDEDLTLEPMPSFMYQSLDPSSANVALERSASVSHVRPNRPVSASHFDDNDSSDVPEANGTSLKRASSAAHVRKPLYNRTTSQPGTNRTKPTSRLPVQTSRRSVNSTSASTSSAPSTWRGQSKMNDAQAAVTIQKVWRGYQTRNLNPKVQQLKNNVRLSRAEEHVRHLSKELASTREMYLTGPVEQKDQSLSNGFVATAEEYAQLKESHERLQSEVNDLQKSMQQVLDWIVCSQPVPRPRSLALTSKSAPSVQQPVESFAQGMADRLIQSVSESKSDPNSS